MEMVGESERDKRGGVKISERAKLGGERAKRRKMEEGNREERVQGRFGSGSEGGVQRGRVGEGRKEGGCTVRKKGEEQEDR